MAAAASPKQTIASRFPGAWAPDSLSTWRVKSGGSAPGRKKCVDVIFDILKPPPPLHADDDPPRAFPPVRAFLSTLLFLPQVVRRPPHGARPGPLTGRPWDFAPEGEYPYTNTAVDPSWGGSIDAEKFCFCCGLGRDLNYMAEEEGWCDGCGAMLYGTFTGSLAPFRNNFRMLLLRRLTARQPAAGLTIHCGAVPLAVFEGLFYFAGGDLTVFKNRGSQGGEEWLAERRVEIRDMETIANFLSFETTAKGKGKAYGCAVVTEHGEVLVVVAPLIVTYKGEGRTTDELREYVPLKYSYVSVNGAAVVSCQVEKQDFGAG